MNQEQNNFNMQNNNTADNNPLYTNQIIGYDSQTGAPIYRSNNIQNNIQVSSVGTTTSMPNNINCQMQTSVQYASFGERFMALLRDFLSIWWLSILGFFLVTMIRIFLRSQGMNEGFLYQILGVIQILGAILFIIYGHPLYSFFADASSKHATKGKRKRNICVVNKEGKYLTFGESFLRMILKYVTLFIPGGVIISIILIIFSEKKQALHDLVLGQYVVKNNFNN